MKPDERYHDSIDIAEGRHKRLRCAAKHQRKRGVRGHVRNGSKVVSVVDDGIQVERLSLQAWDREALAFFDERLRAL